MDNIRRLDEKATLTSNLTEKKLFRQILEYGQRIESVSKSTKHTIDIFKPDLKALRKKFCEKCTKILLVKSSFSHKAEELLWKRGFYDVVQRCKQHPQALDGTSPLYQSYSSHITTALEFYDNLLHKMERQFHKEYSLLSQMNGSTLGGKDVQWLKDIVYKFLTHLGDLARYQVSLGGDISTAVLYYHKAITMDPTNGTVFNQLAVLAGNKNEYLDSIYYYQRSIMSAQPFSGSERNMVGLFEKNYQALEHMKERLIHVKEPDMREATKKIFLLQFIRLQHILYPNNKTPRNGDRLLNCLCEETLESFKQCLEYDLQVFKEGCDERVENVLSGKHATVTSDDKIILRQDILFKLIALSILPSHSLRHLGSTLTPTATSFALSIFTRLLHHSFRCISQLVISAINMKYKSASGESLAVKPSESEIIESLEHGRSIVDIMLEHNVPELVSQYTEEGEKTKKQETPSKFLNTSSPAASISTPYRRFKKPRIVDRRRKRKGGAQLPSSEEDTESDSDSPNSDGSVGQLSGDENLSLVSENLGEDDLELLDSLSDSSSSDEVEEEEEEHESAVSVNKSEVPGILHSSPPAKRVGKRQIILAANFNMPTSVRIKTQSVAPKPKPGKIPDKDSGDDDNDRGSANLSSLPHPSPPDLEKDGQLQDLVKGTLFQTAVYIACSLVAEDSSLMALRVFSLWLQSYPIIIATCTSTSVVSSVTMWSHIACLLNVLPTRQDIVKTNVAVCVNEQKVPLLEDMVLREFAPISPSQHSLKFGVDEMLSKIQETSYRVFSLQEFGQFLSEARTAPSFTWDHSIEKFEGPAQKALKQQDIAKATEKEGRKQAELNRSKLMKAMAQQRLQSEVKSLAEATSKTENTIFTPYLIPDGNSLCNGLHIVKKLIKTEKFIFIITKAVIEALDIMKKGRESYAAREAIKFLERELHSGNKFIQPQKITESLNSGKKKPAKMEMQDWLFECLVDCAGYFNQTYATEGQTRAMVTLIVEKSIVDAMNNPTKKQQEELSHVTEVLLRARQSGVDIETIIGFHINWSKNSKKNKN